MKRIIITLASIMLVALAFGQVNIKADEIRLSPRLLNYQGFLTDTLNNPINDSLDITFRIYDAASAGNIIWFETQFEVPVLKGIFHVLLGSTTSIPDSVFTKSTGRWLELRISSQNLTPRTRIVSAPYAYTAAYSDTALYALTAPMTGAAGGDLTGSYPNPSIASNAVNSGKILDGSVISSDLRDTTIIASKIKDAAVTMPKIDQAGAGPGQVIKWNGTAWQPDMDASFPDNDWIRTNGKVYTFNLTDSVGINTTTPRYALDVNGVICGGESDTVKAVFGAILGGSSNLVGDGSDDSAAVVCGGYNNTITAKYSFIGGGLDNAVTYHYATVVGGWADTATGQYSFIGGGQSNLATFDNAVVAGGYNNTASGATSTICGGFQNVSSNAASFVGGGAFNVASEYNAVVAGGEYNTASGWSSTVSGGYSNAAIDNASVVGGGREDTARAAYGAVFSGRYNHGGNDYSDTAAVVCGGWNNSALEKYTFVGGGRDNYALDLYAVIGGGQNDSASGQNSFIGGGSRNKASGFNSSVVAGFHNVATGPYSIIGGGANNDATYDAATVCGGADNTASGYGSFIGGGGDPNIWPSGNTASGIFSAVVGGSRNMALANYAFIGTGYFDTVNAVYGAVVSGYSNKAGDAAADTGAVICGGYNNTVTGKHSFIGGGLNNLVTNNYATVVGGSTDTATGQYSCVGGGRSNVASGELATIAGGWENTASSQTATVGGGGFNTAGGFYATVGGGYGNYAGSPDATVSGGYSDSVVGNYGFAANYSAYVLSGDDNSAALTTSHTTAGSQVRAASFSTGTLDFAMDHPDDPMNKILNQYGVSSDEVQSQYSGTAVLGDKGRAVVKLPDYFDDINRNPRIQLTGVGSPDVVYVAEDVRANSFEIGGKPGMKVYWEVTAERTDIHAEIARIQTPVVQEKTGHLRGHSIDDDAMIGMYDEIKQKNPQLFVFKTEEGRRVHEQAKQIEGSK